MLNPTETHGRVKGFFMPRRCSSSHGLWLSVSMCVCVCPCMLGREKEFESEWRCHCQTLASTWICSRMAILAACLCVLSERVCRGSAVSPPHRVLTAVIGAQQDAGLYFILIHIREAVSSPTHMFLIRCVFILPHDVLGRGSLSSPQYWK